MLQHLSMASWGAAEAIKATFAMRAWRIREGAKQLRLFDDRNVVGMSVARPGSLE
jgi:hypothetical protein